MQVLFMLAVLCAKDFDGILISMDFFSLLTYQRFTSVLSNRLGLSEGLHLLSCS